MSWLKDQLIRSHDKDTSEEIMQKAIADPKLVGRLLDLMLSDDPLLAQRAAWPLGKLGDDHAELLSPHYDKMLQCLERPSHPAISRNVYRILQNMNIPEDHQGSFFELCARDLGNPKKPVAIKVFAMTVAYNISKEYPDLKPELKLLIEESWDGSSAGYRSRGAKILKKL